MKTRLSLIFWLVLGSMTWFSLVGGFDAKSLGLGLAVILSAWSLTEYMSSLKTGIPARNTLGLLKNLTKYFFVIVLPGFVRAPFFVCRACLGGPPLKPVLLAISLPGASKESLLLMSIGISMSPDQQVLAIDDQRAILYVHAMHAEDVEGLRGALTDHYHRFVKEGTRK